MAIRLSTLAEIKVLSLSAYLTDMGLDYKSKSLQDILTRMEEFRTRLVEGDVGAIQALRTGRYESGLPIFKTVGLARNVRIDEDYGTQNIYAIGSPNRPRIVPNNMSVNVTAERLQLDTKDLNHHLTSPEFWYADDIQKAVGIDDFLLYTFFSIRSKEETGVRTDIYALMPRSSSKAITSGDVMVAHNVSLTGFKYSYEQAWLDSQNLIDESVTGDANPGSPVADRGLGGR